MNGSSEKDQIISCCENLIKQIKDIVSAKIITDSGGKISAIHVVSKSGRNPKQIVRDIESTLIAFLGSEIDHKKISVAQINNGNVHVTDMRLKIQGISTNKTQHYLEIKVLLTDSEGKIYEGIAKGTASPQSRLSTTASATINAIQLFVGDSFVISLDDVHVFYIGNVQAVSILISVLTPEKDEQLLGGALVKHDIYEAVAQAVLSALNRRISFLIKE